MSQADQHVILGAAELATGGIMGLAAGVFLFPIYAAFSPLCLWQLDAGGCLGLAGGTYLLLEPLGLASWMEIAMVYSLLAVIGALLLR